MVEFATCSGRIPCRVIYMFRTKLLSYLVESVINCYHSSSSECLLLQVIRTYRQATDRTALPTDLMAELEVVKTQERERRGEVGQSRARQRI